jgi:hypothetical protein
MTVASTTARRLGVLYGDALFSDFHFFTRRIKLLNNNKAKEGGSLAAVLRLRQPTMCLLLLL